jgi:hypothetical protein
MSLVMEMKKQGGGDRISGICEACYRRIWESLATLDDAYNVWAGKCPYCGAINFLSMNHGLRGYNSREMFLTLPYDEEAKANNLPEGTPTKGPGGKPAYNIGTNAGAIQMKLRGEALEKAEEGG